MQRIISAACIDASRIGWSRIIDRRAEIPTVRTSSAKFTPLEVLKFALPRQSTGFSGTSQASTTVFTRFQHRCETPNRAPRRQISPVTTEPRRQIPPRTVTRSAVRPGSADPSRNRLSMTAERNEGAASNRQSLSPMSRCTRHPSRSSAPVIQAPWSLKPLCGRYASLPRRMRNRNNAARTCRVPDTEQEQQEQE